jgi:hypothetical protein
MISELMLLRGKLGELGELVERLELELVDDPRWEEPSDVTYLSTEEQEDPDVMANVEAMAKTNELVDWFGRDMEGYVGLWRGPACTPREDAPVVRLDTEGQYDLLAVGVGNYLAVAAGDTDFEANRLRLLEAGFSVEPTPDDVGAALVQFASPNEYRHNLYNAARLRRGLPPVE